MKKTTLVSSSIIAASLFGAALIAPPMNVNPLQPQVVQADSLSDLKSASEKLNKLLTNHTYDATDYINSFQGDIEHLNNTVIFAENADLFNDKFNEGALRYDPLTQTCKVNNEAIATIFNGKISGLSVQEKLALDSVHPKFSISITTWDSNGSNTYDAKHPFRKDALRNFAYSDEVHFHGGNVTLTYKIIGDNGPITTAEATATFNNTMHINTNNPDSITVTQEDDVNDFNYGPAGITVDPGENDLDLILKNTELSKVMDDSNLPAQKFEIGKNYTQKITINLHNILIQSNNYRAVVDNGNLYIDGNQIAQSQLDKDGKYTYTRNLTVKAPIQSVEITVKNPTLTPNYGDKVVDYQKVEDLDITGDKNYSATKIKQYTTIGKLTKDNKDYDKDSFEAGEYKQDVTINLRDLLGNKYDEIIKNNKLTIGGSNSAQLDKDGNYFYTRNLTVKAPIQSVEITVKNPTLTPNYGDKVVDYQKVEDLDITGDKNYSATKIKQYTTIGKLTKDNKDYDKDSFEAGEYKQDVTINLRDLLGNKYDEIIKNNKLTIGGSNSAQLDKDGNYFYTRNLTVKAPGQPQPKPIPKPKPTPSPSPVPQPAPIHPSEQPVNSNQENDITGIVRVVSDYTHVYNSQGQVIDGRILSLNSAWKIDRKRIVNINGEIYYRVSTDEYVKNNQVVFDYDYQYDSLQKPTTITALNTPRVVRVVIPNYISLWSKSDDNQHMSKIGDRNLAYNSEWKIDQIAVVDGVAFYRVSSNEWVKAVQVILVDINGLLTGDLKVSNLPSSINIKVTAPGYVRLWSKLSDNLHMEEIPERTVITNSIWKSDQTVMIDGITFYRISTNEWIQDNRVTIIK
ncbi:MAG: SLAP domain-containing protein [Lactobacillus sp.]|nr:SLAP domain-containing protein [Lactobacillus sp.]